MAWGSESRHARGYGAAWVKLRKQAIDRDKGLCQPCRKAGRVTAFNSVDHIKPKHIGGGDEIWNLQCICGPCHTAKTEREAAHAQGRATVERWQIGPDGWPVET